MLISSDIESHGFNRKGINSYESEETVTDGKTPRAKYIITCYPHHTYTSKEETSEVKIQENGFEEKKSQWRIRTKFDGWIESPKDLRTVLLLTKIIQK